MKAPESVVSLRVFDPESLAAAIRGADLEICQLSSAPSLSWLARIVLPGVCLDFASLGPAMLISGSMPKGFYTLVFVTACPEKGRSFNFSLEHNDGYLGFFPPGGHVDAFTPQGYANATLSVSVPVFEHAVERFFPEIPASVLKQGAGLRIGAAEQARLRGLLAAVQATVENSFEPSLGSAARDQLEIDLLDAFMIALRGGCESLMPSPRPRVAGRLRRLRKAREFLADHLQGPVSLTALCEEMGMSRRGVELLFHDSMGIGPNAFIRHQRLHTARRALMAAPKATGSVKQIALACGFWHMGHFASDYRRLFGECPSETLR